MRILKMRVSGLKQFKNSLEIDFYAKKNVYSHERNGLFKVFDNVYSNNVVSFVGINAAGKTSVLNGISFVISMLSGERINNTSISNIVRDNNSDDEILVETYFTYNGDKCYYLWTKISRDKNKREADAFFISEEKLFSKSISKQTTKNNLFTFTESNLELERNGNEDFLLRDVSIIIKYNKDNDDELWVFDTVYLTNTNSLAVAVELVPNELVRFLDPSIEYIQYITADKKYKLKFVNQNEILINKLHEMESFLSSGTIKGINLFEMATYAFETGGYLIIDELENHFNKEIVVTLIRLFNDPSTNFNGGTLIFSSHYAELLDEFERNDNIFITRNTDGMYIENLSDVLKRKDIKKSEVYQSDFLRGTAPSYDAFMSFKKTILANSSTK